MRKSINDIPYMDIIKKSWAITWNNKFLWWFGLIIAFSGGGSFNGISNGGTNAENGKTNEALAKVTGFISNHSEVFWVIVGVIALVCLAILIFSIIARGGIIKSIDNIQKNKETGFKIGMKEGKKYFWKLLSLSILISFFLVAVIFILFGPVIFLFVSKAYLAGIILTICAICIIVPLAILASFTKTYAQIYIVLGEIPVWPAIEKSSNLFLKNILTSIIMSIIFLAIGLAMAGVALIAFIALLIVFGIPTAIIYFASKSIAASIIIAALGIFTFLAFLLTLRSAYEAFAQTAWLLFFREIAMPSEEEKVEEVIHEIEKEEAVPTTGDVAVKTSESEK